MHGGWNKGLIQTDWSRQIKEKYGEQFELLSVSETNEKGERTLIIRCSTCGTEKKISSITTRGNEKRRCLVCFPQSHRKPSKKLAVEKEIQHLDKKLKREKKQVAKRLKSNQVGLKLCICGQAFITQNRLACDECKRKNLRATEYRSETKRRIKAKASRFDSDITLERLFERDQGVCYLCDGLCDWKDYKRENGNFIVGGNYPTIEHVIALCNGGTHTWDNVRLACHACNTKKGRKLLAG